MVDSFAWIRYQYQRLTRKIKSNSRFPFTNAKNRSAAIEDQFPDEHVFVVTVKTSWYTDVANYLEVGKLPKHLTPNERKQIIQRNTQFSWIGGYLFHTRVDMNIRRCAGKTRSSTSWKLATMGLVADILQITRLVTRYYRWAIIGPPFWKMPRSLSRHATVAKEWNALGSLMRCPCTRR